MILPAPGSRTVGGTGIFNKCKTQDLTLFYCQNRNQRVLIPYDISEGAVFRGN